MAAYGDCGRGELGTAVPRPLPCDRSPRWRRRGATRAHEMRLMAYGTSGGPSARRSGDSGALCPNRSLTRVDAGTRVCGLPLGEHVYEILTGRPRRSVPVRTEE